MGHTQPHECLLCRFMAHQLHEKFTQDALRNTHTMRCRRIDVQLMSRCVCQLRRAQFRHSTGFDAVPLQATPLCFMNFPKPTLTASTGSIQESGDGLCMRSHTNELRQARAQTKITPFSHSGQENRVRAHRRQRNDDIVPRLTHTHHG
jgi:hypothetical protein